ncbi:MAG: S-layer homology domain-containing protein [Tissierellia bacterium]|nr:S-layer homology domain-containing protein [Tissierellia bacterium]
MKRFLKGLSVFAIVFVATILLTTNVFAEGEPFTVTKRPLNDSIAEETHVGNFNSFYDATVSVNNKENSTDLYIITMNRDYDVKSDESSLYVQYTNVLLRSAEGGPYTLKNLRNSSFLTVNTDCKFTIENIILDGNGTGEAIDIFKNGKATLGDGTVLQNFSDVQRTDGSAIYLFGDGATLNVLEGATIQNNKAESEGRVSGVIYGKSNTIINISGGTFKNNATNYFGGVIFTYGTLNISGGTFKDNKAAKSGGAIAAYGNELNITGGEFIENASKESGGAIICSKDGQEITIKNATFKQNGAGYHGGAINKKKGNLIVVDNSTFEGNTAQFNGGAISIEESTKKAQISNSTFAENIGFRFGGGIYAKDQVNLTVTKSTFKENVSVHGAGIYASENVSEPDNSNLKIEEVSFEDNVANLGAGVYTLLPTQISASSFLKNRAIDVTNEDNKVDSLYIGRGGAIYVADNKTEISGSSFKENYAMGHGGAIQVDGVIRDDDDNITDPNKNVKLEITNKTQFLSNTADIGEGGAIHVFPYQYATEITEEDAYLPLKTDATTLFKGNVSNQGLHNPPINYVKFKNDLQFSDDSDVLHDILTRKSLLNNYDVNYKSDTRLIIFDANGGKFEGTNETKVVEEQSLGATINICKAPVREGYKFLHWAEPVVKPGDEYVVKGNHVFKAVWKEISPEPKPDDKPGEKPDDNHSSGKGPFGGIVWKPEDTTTSESLNTEDHYQYLQGYPDGSFAPNRGMTRAEVAVMFTRLLNERPKSGVDYPADFTDVQANDWYKNPVGYAAQVGIVSGYPDGTFGPNKSITRAEFATIAARFAQLTEGEEVNFVDLTDAHWSYKSVQLAAANGWISGYPDGTFRPDKEITRAEVTAITNRMLNRRADLDWIDAHENEVVKFTDVMDNDWFYEAIMEATMGHDFNKDKDGKVEYWKNLNQKSFIG